MSELTVSEDELGGIIRYGKLEETVEAEPAERREIHEAAMAAKIYLRNAGIDRPESDTELYDLALKSLSLHYYDHRDAVGSEAAIPLGLRPIINQLKLHGTVLAALGQ